MALPSAGPDPDQRCDEFMLQSLVKLACHDEQLDHATDFRLRSAGPLQLLSRRVLDRGDLVQKARLHAHSV